MTQPREPIYIFLGTDHDPLPEEPKRTRYWVAAGPCPSCGSAARRLLREEGDLTVRCVGCGHRRVTGLSAGELNDVSYVFWCSSPRFETDDLELTTDQQAEIERLLAEFGDPEPTYLGVVVESGVCRRTRECINAQCPYNHRSSAGDA